MSLGREGAVDVALGSDMDLSKAIKTVLVVVDEERTGTGEKIQPQNSWHSLSLQEKAPWSREN